MKPGSIQLEIPFESRSLYSIIVTLDPSKLGFEYLANFYKGHNLSDFDRQSIYAAYVSGIKKCASIIDTAYKSAAKLH